MRLGRADSAAAGWPLRLSSRCALALFPEREASFMEQGSATSPLTATDGSGTPVFNALSCGRQS